ncbi:hypothetical protein [Clostridium sp.]|uniref:hypothetical protein n=1 Tax=Clostridium sp. TaxID=1506 RepID=UPI003F3A4818
MKVELSDVMEAIEFEGEVLTHYYNKKTGVIIYLEDESSANYKAEDINNIESFEEWERELITALHDLKANPEDYIQLPCVDEINEYNMLKEFSKDISDDSLTSLIGDSNGGEDEIREIIEQIRKIGKIEEWYDFREEAEYNLAKEWCNKNNISYIE